MHACRLSNVAAVSYQAQVVLTCTAFSCTNYFQALYINKGTLIKVIIIASMHICTHSMGPPMGTHMPCTWSQQVHDPHLPHNNSPPGYGFVDFENPTDAQNAVAALQAEGVLAQFAKLPQVPNYYVAE